MGLSDKAILAKARAMYGHHLDGADYNQLLERRSIADVVAYLRSDTDYAKVFEGIREDIHRGRLEAILNEESFFRVSRMIRYAPKKEQSFYSLGITKNEIEIILHRIRSLMNNRLDDFHLSFPGYLKKYASFPIERLLEVRSLEDLYHLLEKTRYQSVLKTVCMQKSFNMNTLELELKRAFYDTYIETINHLYKGKQRTELLTMIETQLELENITKIYRLKKYFQTNDQDIKSVLLLDHSRMSKKMINDLISSKDADELLVKLANSPYKLYVDDNEYVYIEYYTQKIVYNLARRHMRFSSQSPLVYMTYVFIHAMETENLKHIIEGLRYGESPDEIRKLLIY